MVGETGFEPDRRGSDNYATVHALSLLHVSKRSVPSSVLCPRNAPDPSTTYSAAAAAGNVTASLTLLVTDRRRTAGERSRGRRPSVCSRRRLPWTCRPHVRAAPTVARATSTAMGLPAPTAHWGRGRMGPDSPARSTLRGRCRGRARAATPQAASALSAAATRPGGGSWAKAVGPPVRSRAVRRGRLPVVGQ